MKEKIRRLVVGITGTSGVIYGIRLLEVLRTMDGVETHLVMSRYARLNIEIETDHTPQEVEALADEETPVLNDLISLEEAQSLNGAVTNLDTKYRVPLILAYFNQLSYDEIAEQLGVSYYTVRNHVQHVLGKMGVHSTLEAVALYLLSQSQDSEL